MTHFRCLQWPKPLPLPKETLLSTDVRLTPLMDLGIKLLKVPKGYLQGLFLTLQSVQS